LEGFAVQVQLGEIFREIPSQLISWVVVVYICNSSYVGDIGKRIPV
jgi:hypothetical protein